ncbi:unnamed protein product [Lasius platythorax]|uniref:Uncharacterized protein n=1 Tax=Lasius platythorax TaxID=488582 RepID=A0AAV2P199_9HYME
MTPSHVQIQIHTHSAASLRRTRLAGMESDALVGLGRLGWAICSIPDTVTLQEHPIAWYSLRSHVTLVTVSSLKFR